MAAVVFAICSSENSASCMRAPPLAAKHTSGARRATLTSAARANRSPTTEPIEPPMNLNSNATATTGAPCNAPARASNASLAAEAFFASLNRSRYRLRSRNFSISTGATPSPNHSTESGSRKACNRARADSRMWWLHFGQTCKPCCNSTAYNTA